jgi:hydrogenase nickel incorporation protein HypA/HybF
MHELSIAQSIVEVATESAVRANATRVLKVNLRLGALSGVVKDSLLFCYDLSTQDTMLEGSSLEFVELPVIIHCAQCAEDRELPGIRQFRCPVCGTPSGDVRQGQELEIGSLELEIP